MIPATEALERLRDGNRRFVNDERGNIESVGQARRAELAGGQTPFAVIVACSDSRVPVEFLFDQGLGDLFVIRVAGNIVAPSQIGSIEYAVGSLGTRLVVILGHSHCGAIEATLQELGQSEATGSPNHRSIVDRIRPALEPLLQAHGEVSLDDAVAANVRYSVERLRHDSDILAGLVASGELIVVGAEYSIQTGMVRFFNG